VRTMKTLLDMARAKVHSDAELCRLIDIKPPNLVEIRQGKRAVSAEQAAALCDVLELSGEECREWVAVAMIENPKNARCADRLRRALFACWVLGVAALMQPIDAQARSGAYTARVDVLYIVAHWLRWLTQPLRCALRAQYGCRMGRAAPTA